VGKLDAEGALGHYSEWTGGECSHGSSTGGQFRQTTERERIVDQGVPHDGDDDRIERLLDRAGE
jgi:hypothetical protein